MAQNNREFLASDPKTIRWSVCKENQWNSFPFYFRIYGKFPCKISGIDSEVKIGKVLPDSWQEIPVHKLKMCVYSRESSYFSVYFGEMIREWK